MKRVTFEKPTTKDVELLYETVKIAKDAVKAGNHPFGALLADKDGNILMTQGNDSLGGSPCLHAEANLMIRAGKEYPPSFLETCTMYTNFEPCAMCAGAMYWTNVHRVVFGLTERQLLQMTGSHEENPTLDLPAADVFERGQKDIVVVGPVDDPALVEAIIEDHRNFWKK
ncbi:cytosine/adenosine deaminase [Tritrichomonas foetus]|uniref:Cytosine/adenosine deaminase n=1 Tax=Tritrichomonas foetus TaxID=1144522 RepID=A0A1J4KCT1_9EUKA|nr:cytosine/adenosine deaminase [Tritrichomonas foetus]|eukprot:OHT09225.1 cytosine/adenosine deaminase [Tritrichomonas foetus]